MVMLKQNMVNGKLEKCEVLNCRPRLKSMCMNSLMYLFEVGVGIASEVGGRKAIIAARAIKNLAVSQSLASTGAFQERRSQVRPCRSSWVGCETLG
jgi:hypothetical protein